MNTMPPPTLLTKILHRQARVGKDFFLAFSPERIDPGRSDYTVENTPKVVGGVTPACLEVATALYRQAIERVVPVSSTQAAEMVRRLSLRSEDLPRGDYRRGQ